MRISTRTATWTMTVVAVAAACLTLHAQDESLEDNLCVQCHGTPDLWEKDTLHLFVTAEDLADDVHWQKGIRCHDCHGGNPRTFELRQAHAIEDGFRKIESPADIPDFCGYCHANADYMQALQPDAATDLVSQFWSSVHGQHLKSTGGSEAADCTSCHPKHQMRTATDPLSAVHSSQLAQTCGACHQEQLVELRKSVHSKAGERNEMGAGTLLDCAKCHGQDVHGMLPAEDSASPVFLDHQIRVCGSCHERYLETYQRGVHGVGLQESGLLVTAVCADCHGAHGIYYAADKRSTLHVTNVAESCGACHHFLAERLAKSVHGGEGGFGQSGERVAPGGTRTRKPSCTDCHQGHDQPHPDTFAFQRRLPSRCGNCHAGLSDRYHMSLHGELTQLGYEPAAGCGDCHGSHDILPATDPHSRLATANRVQTCRRCHPNAVVSFANFDPHASYKDKQAYPLLHGVYVWLEFIIYTSVGVFFLHGIIWFTRTFVHARQFGRDRVCVAEQPAVASISPMNRTLYVLFMLTFVGLVLTGLPLKYGSNEWARRLAEAVGGFQSTSVWHHFCALALLTGCVVHLVCLGRDVRQQRRQGVGWKTILWGPDSPIPNRRDYRDFVLMLRWFVGLGNKPRFERWTYWEKFDYWAIYGGVALVGTSGLMLWFPNLFCRVLPGQILNLAKVIHSEVGFVAVGFIFMIHAFNTHLRPERFPVNLSWLTGLVSEQHLRRMRPEFLQRLQREGRLDALRTTAPPRRRLRAIAAVGFMMLSVGLLLLAVIVLVALGK